MEKKTRKQNETKKWSVLYRHNSFLNIFAPQLVTFVDVVPTDREA